MRELKVRIMTILSGHISPETAYLIKSYPYGFRLRCQMRYWLDWHPKRGARLMSQTSNPKQPGLVWNKPKASTYSVFGGAMYLDDKGHVAWSGAHEYMSASELVVWRDHFGGAMPEDAQKRLKAWIARKLTYELAKQDGLVKCTMTTTQYGCVTDPGFGTPIAPPTVETTVLKSDYTPEQLMEMGRTLRADATTELAKLTA
jgi:hypothetical protein